MTGRAIYRQCRRADIVLGIEGDDITFDAPGGVTVPVDELRRCKDELLCILAGDYRAAAATLLLLRVADPCWRVALAEGFDERVRICMRRYMGRGEAERVAYVELARALEGMWIMSADAQRKHDWAATRACARGGDYAVAESPG